MSIRPFQPDDLPTIMDIGNRAWRPIKQMTRNALGDQITNVLNPRGDDATKGLEIEQQAIAHPENIFICEENGRIVGFITFQLNPSGIGEILNNAVDPACGLKGIGQQMYQTVLNHFRRHGMKAAKVFTGLDDAHAPARRAYERAGFNRTLQHVSYYMELTDADQ